MNDVLLPSPPVATAFVTHILLIALGQPRSSYLPSQIDAGIVSSKDCYYSEPYSTKPCIAFTNCHILVDQPWLLYILPNHMYMCIYGQADAILTMTIRI